MENRFDLYELPEGHEERFLAKWDAHIERQQRTRARLTWAAAAAAAAIVLLLVLPFGDRHFRGARTPEAVYCSYLEQVGSYYEQLAQDSGSDPYLWEATLTSLTRENIPLYDQLPEEMSNRQKTRILKQYYGELLDGAHRIRQEWNN